MVNEFAGKQLTLSVEIREDANFKQFIGTPSEKCAVLLEDALHEGSETLIYVSGAKESGKTHLASAAIHYCEAHGKAVAYFAMNDLAGIDDSFEALFEELDSFDVVVLENIDRWLAVKDDEQLEARERALFNIFNEFKQSGQQLILTARASVGNLEIHLADLASRIQSGLSLTLSPFSDEAKQKILQNAAMERGLEMSDEISSFIIRRSGRNMGQLFAVLDSLDRASLEEKRRLTVPFVKKVLDW